MNGGNSGYIFYLYFEFVFCLKINMSCKTKISLRNLVFSNFYSGGEIEVNVSWELCVDTRLKLLLILKDTPELTGRLCRWRVMPRQVLHRCWIKVVLLVHPVKREIETVLLKNLT